MLDWGGEEALGNSPGWGCGPALPPGLRLKGTWGELLSAAGAPAVEADAEWFTSFGE